MKSMELKGFALAALALGACADGGSGLGELRLALSFEDQVSFRLQVFTGPVGTDLDGTSRFDSGCVTRQSTTLELSRLPVGDDYSVVYRAWDDAACSGTPVAFGFRGGIELEADTVSIVHVPVYANGIGNLLPVDLNLSALASTSVASCDNGGGCGSKELCVATDSGSWCVPTCAADTDCAELHPNARCDTNTDWCMLDAPWPLNTSEPRAFSRAMSHSNGDVVVFGGLRHAGNGRLEPLTYPVEVFDAKQGLFKAFDLVGFFGGPAAAFGFAPFGGDQAIVAGGVKAATQAVLSPEGPRLEANWRTDGIDRVFVLDFTTGKAISAPLGEVVVSPGVIDRGSNRFIVVGGRTLQGQNNLTNSDRTWLCELDGAGALGCVDGPKLAKARVEPALFCMVDGGDTCARVAVVGGNEGGNASNLVEVIDLSANPPSSASLDVQGAPDVILSPVFCGATLVGGGAPNGAELPQFSLDLAALAQADGEDDAAMPLPAPQGVPLWAAHAADGCGFVAGGVVPSFGATDSVWTTGGDGTLLRAGGDLGRVRVAAAAGRVGAGPLAGSWLVVGGLEPGAQGNVMRVINGAEIWRP
jgi:hypothetical protein